MRFVLLIGLALLSASVGAAAAPHIDVEIAVMSCGPDASAQPAIRIADIDRIFATVDVPIKWANANGVWVGTTAVPQGHYIVHARTEHCSGRNAQWVAIPGALRHVTVVLNEIKVVSTDEDMYAGTIFGRVPLPGAVIEVMSADSPLGEQTRRPVPIDGDSFQLGHLEPGNYVVLITFGGVRAAKPFAIPHHIYGPTIDASMTTVTAIKLVRAEQAGSGFVDHTDTRYGPYSTFGLGNASADGWTAQPLPQPADYAIWQQRFSLPEIQVLEMVRHFLEADVSLPDEFRTIEAFRVQIAYHQDGLFRVRLVPADIATWRRSIQKVGSCSGQAFSGNEPDALEFNVDPKGGQPKIIDACP